MRLFEIIILIINLPLVYWLFLPSQRFPSWLRFLPLLGAVITIIHLVVEGYRWQMFPLYLLSLILLLLVIIKHFPKSDQPIIQSKFQSIAIGSVGVLFLGLAAVFGTLLPIFSLPQPTGPYPVGTVSYHWIDETREEVLTDDPTDKREIMVQIWYPAAHVAETQPNYYWQDYAEIMGPALAKNQRLPAFVLSHFNRIKTNAYFEAPLSDQQSTYPVVIYSHGNGCGRSWATNQMEDLASHGYIVIAFDNTYDAMATVFPDGRIIFKKYFHPPMIAWESLADSTKKAIIADRNKILSASIRLPGSKILYDSVCFRDKALNDAVNETPISDISFILSRLEELNTKKDSSIFSTHLNFGQIGVMGFSDGGGPTRGICERDQRIRAGLTLDANPPYKENTNQPFLCLFSDPKPPRSNRKDDINEMKARRKGKDFKIEFVLIEETLHNNFTDGPLFSPLKQATEAGPIDPDYTHHIVNTLTVAFFDKHLKGEENISISSLAQSFPEVYYDSLSTDQ